MSITFKISRQTSKTNAEFRRILATSSDDLRIANLRAKTAKLFTLPLSEWYFTWTDEEGDKITLTEQNELDEAVQYAHSQQPNKVIVKLEIIVPQSQEAKGAQDSAPQFPRPEILDQGLNVIHDLLRSFSSHPHHQRPHPKPRSHPTRHGEAPVLGYCDITGKRLTPGDDWYHIPNSTNDLCAQQFASLSDEHKKSFVNIKAPSDLGEDLKNYQRPRRSCCPYVIQEPCFGLCDVTDERLVPNGKWFHKPGTSYDLIDYVYATLTPEEQQQYVRISSPSDLGADLPRYQTGSFAGQQANQTPRPQTPAQPTTTETPQSQVSDTHIQPQVEYAMKVVSGPTLTPDAKLVSGARIMPVWEVANFTKHQGSLWTDVRVRARDPNPLRLREEGVEVPMIEAGKTGFVCLDLAIPEESAGQIVEAAFDMYDGNGNIFGEPLTLVVRVSSVEEEKNRPLLDALREMGFADDAHNLSVLQANNGDLSATVLALIARQ